MQSAMHEGQKCTDNAANTHEDEATGATTQPTPVARREGGTAQTKRDVNGKPHGQAAPPRCSIGTRSRNGPE
jgi:hypothetical protein